MAQAQVMQACLSAVKTSMLVVQRSQELVSAALLAKPPPSPCALRDTLNTLLACYTRILTDGKGYILCNLQLFSVDRLIHCCCKRLSPASHSSSLYS